MIRSLLLALILVSAPLLAQAQAGTPAAEHKFSVSTGLGFMSSIGSGAGSVSSFLWQIDAQYFLTDAISAGLFMQVGTPDGGTIFFFAPDVRYHFNVMDKLNPYAGFGFGLAHAGSDFGLSDNGALFSFIAGVEYDIMDQVALTSDMRFNAIAGNTANDSFIFTWQIIGARYRF